MVFPGQMRVKQSETTQTGNGLYHLYIYGDFGGPRNGGCIYAIKENLPTSISIPVFPRESGYYGEGL